MKPKTQEILSGLFTRYPALSVCIGSIEQATRMLAESFRTGNKLLICGNGGSAADAQHIVGELMKSFILPRQIRRDLSNRITERFPEDAQYFNGNLQEALPAISLVSETALATAFANDAASDLTFAQQVYALGRSGDCLLAISTSGNSGNVVYAARLALVLGLKVIALTGASGGKLREASDVWIGAPGSETYQVQEYHLPIYHALCLALENEFFGD